MEQGSRLAPAFLVHAKGRFAPPLPADVLEQLLLQQWETARAGWPGVKLPAEPFIVHIAQRLPKASPPGPLEASLQQMSLAELYLACACARGLPAAIALFERHYLAKLPALLRDPQLSDALLDEACQLTRVKLLVATPEGGPRIAEYRGEGSLLSWVRIIAARDADKLWTRQKPGPEEDADLVLEALPAPGVDVEWDLLKRRHHPELRHALREAFAALTRDERYLFRLNVIDRLSTYEMAPLFRVNQSTVSRWLETARSKVREETRCRIQARLRLSPRDLESFLAALVSQLEVGISQLLREDGVPD